MKHFIIEQSDTEFYTPNAGLDLIGLALNRFTSLASSLAKAVPTQDVISHSEVLNSNCGLLSEGKSDFVVVEQYRADEFFRESLDIGHVPVDIDAWHLQTSRTTTPPAHPSVQTLQLGDAV